ncbi:MAG: glycerate kinase [Akkermansiaceae bacterium]|jgi:glycerate kinase
MVCKKSTGFLDESTFSTKKWRMRILIAPDKFKGSLSAKQAAEAIARGFSKVFPSATCTLLPLADGGEGLLNAFQDNGNFTLQETQVRDALGRPATASWLLKKESTRVTAIIESSQANGLWRIAAPDRNPARSSTYGVGELINAAISAGATEILIGIGGSATNDAGVGVAAALGYHFLDASNQELEPIPENFLKITRIDSTQVPTLPTIRVACDVKNPLLGPRGATRVYGPQKGIAPENLETAEAAMQHISSIAAEHFKSDFSEHSGAGAAGGLGFGLMTFCHATLESGFDCIAKTLNAEQHIAAADLVITAEGSLDSQTLEGKTPIGVSQLARKHGIPVYALAGKISDPEMLQAHFHGMDSILNGGVTLEQAIANASELLEQAATRLATTIS